MDRILKGKLITAAIQARKNAYAPYSGYYVGAALLCDDGEIVTGCNVENASYTPTCCAERVAMFSAIADGARGFEAIAVVGGKSGERGQACYPCGVCRQVLAEHCEPSFNVVIRDGDGVTVTTLGELLPNAFKL
jgi:cytidine deaminase